MTNGTMKAPKSGVRIRMYRPGLGDCFLLAFPGKNDQPVYVLIDCGVLTGTSNISKVMHQIALDINDSTGGRIDVVVITHEHFDHLSGFRYKDARKVFDKIEFGEVWVAWTENPDHPLAISLRKERSLVIRALKMAAQGLHAAGNIPVASLVESLLGFSEGVANDLKYVLGKVEIPRFFAPGKRTVAIPGVDEKFVRVYILGPPMEEKTLKKAEPSADSEVYEESPLPLTANSVYATSVVGALASDTLSLEERRLAEMSRPFDRIREISREAAEKNPFYQGHYGFGEDVSEELSWRHIDSDWLMGAEDLALQLDNATNNTCLAMAIELIHSGRVLIFPGDAQVGNLLSWHKHSWKVNGKTVTAKDLLSHTVFYKVGHHGSHNATLREEGLEMMTSNDLVSMIPVEEDMAEKKKWNMPFPLLYERLKEKSKGRVIRIDEGVPKKGQRISKRDWRAFLRNTTEVDNLYIDFVVSG